MLDPYSSLFLAAVAGRAAARVWLANRQIAAVEAHCAEVPALFADQICVDQIRVDNHQRAAAGYIAARMRAGRIGAMTGAAAAVALTVGGGIALVDALWRTTSLAQPWLGTAVVLTVLAVLQLVELPFSIWRTFGLEGRFRFNRTSPRLFAADLAKRIGLGGILVAPLAAATIVLMERGGPWWWVIAWGGWLFVTLTLTWAGPRVVAPLFNRFTPLDNAALEKRVAVLLERCGFRASGVLVMDGSRRSARGNAYFTGIGRNKRIVFFDTLLAKLGPEEVEAVLAHELGHFRLNHLLQRFVVSALLALAGLALLAGLASRPEFYASLGVPTASAHAALLLFVVAAPAFMFFARPLTAWWSRRHELAADEFAARHTSAEAVSDALVKICRDNGSNPAPDPFFSAFYDSHPPAPIRIARLKALAASHRAKAPVIQ